MGTLLAFLRLSCSSVFEQATKQVGRSFAQPVPRVRFPRFQGPPGWKLNILCFQNIAIFLHAPSFIKNSLTFLSANAVLNCDQFLCLFGTKIQVDHYPRV